MERSNDIENNENGITPYIPTPLTTRKLFESLRFQNLHHQNSNLAPKFQTPSLSPLESNRLDEGENLGSAENPENIKKTEKIREKLLRRSKRVKRFTCWHSCLGPWKKRNPRTKSNPYKILLKVGKYFLLECLVRPF